MSIRLRRLAALLEDAAYAAAPGDAVECEGPLGTSRRSRESLFGQHAVQNRWIMRMIQMDLRRPGSLGRKTDLRTRKLAITGFEIQMDEGMAGRIRRARFGFHLVKGVPPTAALIGMSNFL